MEEINMRKFKILLPLLVLMVSLLLLVGCFESTKDDSSYVVLDINPSVELVLNKNDVVEYANALNEDADVLLANLVLEGLSVEAAIELIIEESTNLGFIDPDSEETIVDVTTVNEDEGDEDALGEKIRNKINNAFAERGMHGFAQKKQMTAEIIAEAQELGIGAGRLRLIKQALELNPELTLEELLEMEVKEINELVKVKGNEVKEMTQALRQEFFQQRDQIRAEYQPQIDALRTQIEDLEAQIEAELDEDAKAILEAELEVLEASLEELMATCNQEIKVKREAFKDEIEAARNQIKEQRQLRINEHRANVEQFRENFQNNKDAIQDEIEDWINQKKNSGKN